MNVFVFFAFLGVALAQTPSGIIEGTIRDSVGAPISGARVRVVNVDTNISWEKVTSELGLFSVLALPPGEYLVRVEGTQFESIVRSVTVQTGVTTNADVNLGGGIATSITVESVVPQIAYDSHTIGGSIVRSEIDGLPINGRNVLDLGKTEPGVQSATRASSNRAFLPILSTPGAGNPGRGTIVTVDNGSIMTINNGGSAMGLSQESIQEFQISTVNFDLSTGATVSGAVNVVTRSGGNAVHGSAFYFLRDHNFSAHPVFTRDAANPDPFFQRRQFGFSLGGPIRRDRFFFFGNWERNEQRGVGTTTLNDPDFAHLSRITVSPFFGNQFTVRLDGRLSSTHTGFLRHSHEDNRAFGPPANPRNAYPSRWSSQTGWGDQTVIGVTSAFSSLVNELRFSYFFASAKQLSPTEEECPGCLGVGAPIINVSQLLNLGGADIALNMGRRFHLGDFVTWQAGAHRIRFGINWEHNRGGPLNWTDEPATLDLFSPTQARNGGIAVPAKYETLEDILALPLKSVRVGVGDPRVPQSGGGMVRTSDNFRLFYQDTWRIRPRFVVNYGLAWTLDGNLNADLPKPALLAPILGVANLGPSQKEWTNFSPALGFTWTPSADGDMVVRGGAGLYYDYTFQPGLDAERAALGPPGLGRRTFDGNLIENILPGIQGVGIGDSLNFQTPTAFRGADLIQILPEIRQTLLKRVDNTLELNKQQVTGMNGRDVPATSAVHINAGVQRRLSMGIVVSADLVFRHFTHVGLGSIDMNRFNSGSPVIRECTPVERDSPDALCSTGPIEFFAPIGVATHKGLLVRADKRFSRGFQFTGSWSWSRSTGTSPAASNGFNLYKWHENRGPLSTDLTHILNLAGLSRLPGHFDLGLNFSYTSAQPFTAHLGEFDLNGDGKTGDLLPGSTFNIFNRGLGKDDLERLVSEFNATYAGKQTRTGVLPVLRLPTSYEFGDDFHALDLRLSRSFGFRDSARVTLIGDAFNVYNAANLSGHPGNLTIPGAFGRPTTRANQIFGSGGPRAFQFAVRVSF